MAGDSGVALTHNLVIVYEWTFKTIHDIVILVNQVTASKHVLRTIIWDVVLVLGAVVDEATLELTYHLSHAFCI